MSKKDVQDKACKLIILLVGIIIGGFAYFVADNLTEGEFGQNALFKLRNYSYTQDYTAPTYSSSSFSSTSLNYAKPFPEGN